MEELPPDGFRALCGADAANLLEAMEKAGRVSAMNGRGQREILVPGRGD